ncbi:MAG: hypothetical protein GXY03_16290 [Solirubrobacterales bacterium]|nr:hypothetical protein [Solirubrobacterales bacterium]
MASLTKRTALARTALAVLGALTACALAPAAAAAAGGPIESLQRSAKSLEPAPGDAFDDRGQLAADGCMVEQHEYRFPKCVYGDKRSRKTVVLFGDSQAMHWFPALVRVARERGWRLIGRVRAGCPPAAIRFSGRCDRWRAETLRRIERHDEPDLVVTGSGVVYGAIVGGRRLGSKASAKHLRKGYARTMRRLRRTGAQVAVMKTLSWAPNRIVSCVRDHPRKLRRCAFDRKQPTNRAFEARAAKRVKGARLIDARDAVCLKRICPAVTDGLIVYRDPKHLSATYARTLSNWLDARLPRL